MENIEDSDNQASGSNQFSIDASGNSCYIFRSSYTDAAPLSTSSCLHANPDNGTPAGEVNEEQCREQLTAEVIVDATFHLLDLLDKMGGSLSNFEDLLLMARSMYHKRGSLNDDAEELAAKWPRTWADAKKHLMNVGFKDAKEYFIWLSEEHPCQWDLLEKTSDECQFCGERGTIPCYYLGLETKVKQLVSDPDMCHKMTAHWTEKGG